MKHTGFIFKLECTRRFATQLLPSCHVVYLQYPARSYTPSPVLGNCNSTIVAPEPIDLYSASFLSISNPPTSECSVTSELVLFAPVPIACRMWTAPWSLVKTSAPSTLSKRWISTFDSSKLGPIDYVDAQSRVVYELNLPKNKGIVRLRFRRKKSEHGKELNLHWPKNA
jgi:hypothetical protein